MGCDGVVAVGVLVVMAWEAIMLLWAGVLVVVTGAIMMVIAIDVSRDLLVSAVLV